MKIVTSKPTSTRAREIRPDSAEWRMRVDLAAAHRLAYMHGFSEGIFNHLTCAVPGKSDRYLQIPFGMHWSEVTASGFMEVGYDGKRLKGEGEVEQSCYAIHAPIHRMNPDAARRPDDQADRPDRVRPDEARRLRRALHRPGVRPRRG
jgi:hypothetical protein